MAQEDKTEVTDFPDEQGLIVSPPRSSNKNLLGATGICNEAEPWKSDMMTSSIAHRGQYSGAPLASEVRDLLDTLRRRLEEAIDIGHKEICRLFDHPAQVDYAFPQQNTFCAHDLGSSHHTNGCDEDVFQNKPIGVALPHDVWEAEAQPLEQFGPRSASQFTSHSEPLPRHSTVSTEMIETAARKLSSYEDEDTALFEAASRVSSKVDLECRFPSSQCSSRLGGWRASLNDLLETTTYDIAITVTIIVNAIFIGAESEYLAAHRRVDSPFAMDVVSYSFTLLFTIELIVRMIAEGSRFASGKNWLWNSTDSFIVIVSIIETAVSVLESYYQSTIDGVGNMSIIRAIRVLRITRILRIFRVARIVRFVRALRTLIFSIACTLKSLVWAIMLLMIIIYVFALVFMQSVSTYLIEEVDVPRGCGDFKAVLELQWGSLPTSMFTLFKCICGGISWDEVVQPLGQVSVWLEVVFFVYITFTSVAVLNVVTAVFCQAAIEGAQHDHDTVVQSMLANKNMYVKRTEELFKSLDSDKSGVITYRELEKHTHDPAVKAFFDSIDLTVDDAWMLFRLIDVDKTHSIDIEEFVDGVLRLRGVASSFDMAKLMYDSKWMKSSLANLTEYLQMELSRIKKTVSATSGSPSPRPSSTQMPRRSVANSGVPMRELPVEKSTGTWSNEPRSVVTAAPPNRPASGEGTAETP